METLEKILGEILDEIITEQLLSLGKFQFIRRLGKNPYELGLAIKITDLKDKFDDITVRAIANSNPCCCKILLDSGLFVTQKRSLELCLNSYQRQVKYGSIFIDMLSKNNQKNIVINYEKYSRYDIIHKYLQQLNIETEDRLNQLYTLIDNSLSKINIKPAHKTI